MINWIINLSFILICLSYIFLLIRLIKGPSSPDRVVAFDLISVTTVAFILLFSVSINESVYIDIAIALALVAFLGTVACSRYILHEGKVKDERNI
jgi:multicomponent Na+:H+ antiporter subunit F